MSELEILNYTRSCFAHFKKRARERYKFVLNEFDVCEIALMICNGNGVLKANLQKGRKLVKLKYRGRMLPIVWDPFLQCPVTVLPHRALKSYSNVRL